MKRLLAVCVFFVLPTIANAQTFVNPGHFEVVVTAQHDAVGVLDGLPLVVSYDILISTQAVPTLTVQAFSCAKPAPVTGKITCTIPQITKDALTKNVIHVARARVNGQAGVVPQVSAAGGPFGYAGPVVLLPTGPAEPKQ